MELNNRIYRFPQSHPTGVRGLKLWQYARRLADIESHPTGVRGLKFRSYGSY